MPAPCVLVMLAPEIGADAPPRRQSQGGGQLAVTRCLVCGGKRLVDKRLVDGVLGKAAPDGKGRAAATPLGPGPRHGEGGVIDIAKTGTFGDHHLDGVRQLGRVMRLQLAHGKALEHLAKPLLRGNIAAKIMHRLVHQPLLCAGPVLRHLPAFLIRRSDHSSRPGSLSFAGAKPMFCRMNEQSPPPANPLRQISRTAAASARAPVRPVQIGRVNWIGLWTLYCREVKRFVKVAMQTVIAPVITSMLFLMVFTVAVGDRAQLAGDVSFIAFLVPGLAMMAVLQNAFANSSSSLVVSKVQGNIVDLLMPPIGPGELLVGLALGGMTRGIAVGLVAVVVLGGFAGIGLPAAPLTALAFLVLGSLAMALAGVLAGVWSNKFDEMAAITNFLIQPLAFLSGTFYSVDRLPAPFDSIATFNPFFYAIDGFRSGLIGVGDRSVTIGLVGLVLVNGVLWYLCYRVLESGWRLKS